MDFPVGQAAKGNPGVAGIIAQTPYSLGYIGSEYAFAQKIPYASVYNKRGELVVPSTESISAAAVTFLRILVAQLPMRMQQELILSAASLGC